MAEKCARCGSAHLIPDVPLRDHFGDLGMRSAQAEVEVQGRPDAWLFKAGMTGRLSVCICGECGHAELSVSNHRELYEKYRQSHGQ
jgi:hypothetical protein